MQEKCGWGVGLGNGWNPQDCGVLFVSRAGACVKLTNITEGSVVTFEGVAGVLEDLDRPQVYWRVWAKFQQGWEHRIGCVTWVWW